VELDDRPARPRGINFRRLVVATVVLSVLFHLAAVFALWRWGDRLSRGPLAARPPLWVDLGGDARPRGTIVQPKAPANRVKPDRATHVAAEDHAVPRETRRRDLPVRPFAGGPAPSSPSKTIPDRAPTAPPSDPLAPSTATVPRLSATDLLNRSSFGDYVTSREGSGAFNPDAPAKGDAVWINTDEYKYVGYLMGVRERIEASWKRTRPEYDRERTGAMSMTIAANGDLADVTLLTSCGDRVLDLALLRAVREASPFSPLPESWGQDRFTVNFSFHYLLEQRSIF
jgi:TonB family protein